MTDQTATELRMARFEGQMSSELGALKVQLEGVAADMKKVLAWQNQRIGADGANAATETRGHARSGQISNLVAGAISGVVTLAINAFFSWHRT